MHSVWALREELFIILPDEIGTNIEPINVYYIILGILNII